MEHEYTTASKIKDRTNRHSVQSALKSLVYQLKLIKTIPQNGIALFAGTDCYI